MTQTQTGVGERVKERRKLTGMTQAQLATAASVSLGLVRAVEQGRAPASPSFVAAVASALRISVPELLGQPYLQQDHADDAVVSAGIAIIRSELAAYDLPPAGIQARPLAEVAADVDQMRTYRRAANLYKISGDLPSLMTEVRALVHASTGAEREQAFRLLCELYSSARSIAHKLGYVDLATIAVERMAWAAAQSGSRLWQACAQFFRASILTGAGDWKTASTYMEQCRQDLEHALDDEASRIAWGGLHLQSGLAAARAGDRATADAHLAEARSIASRMPVDFADPVLSFGPANVRIWGVALAVEMLDGTEAVARAEGLVLPPSVPRSRAGHYWIDLSRGYLLHGDKARTLEALQMAKKTTPAQTRYHPMVHETVRVLARQEARSTETVRGFAAWCGITSID